MLSSISWQHYLAAIVILTVSYYGYVILRYYQKEITNLFNRKQSSANLFANAQAKPGNVMGAAKLDNGVSLSKSEELYFSESTPDDFAPVKIISKSTPDFDVDQKENALITIKALTTDFSPTRINVQEISTAKIYHIPVEYSYGRAGRRIELDGGAPMTVRVIKTADFNYSAVVSQLAEGKRKDVVDHEKTGGVKAWVDKLSLAGNRVFFRLDIRNKSNLPYEIDFVRFYIRDLKTVARMATHEQEIVPLITTLHKKTSIAHKQEIAKIFGFHRFSLSEDQALNVELYERNGNRHIYLQIKQKDLDDLKTITPARQQPANTLVAANTL